jgi:hypothetical protein
MMSQESLFWKIFEATGSPDMYLLFKKSNVHEKTGNDGRNGGFS